MGRPLNKITAVFVFDRNTKNTVRYTEDGMTPFAIGTLYIQKWAAEKLGGSTVKLRVTVEPVAPGSKGGK